jgi:predicted lipid-binding transport protein (Tim44 family)
MLAGLAILLIVALFREFGKTREEVTVPSSVPDGAGQADGFIEDAEVRAVREKFPEFDVHDFIEEAERTFLRVFVAFVKSDYDLLGALLTKSLYKKFASQIQKRDESGFKQKLMIQFDKTSIEEVRILRDKATILVFFDIIQMSAISDADGRPVDNPNQIHRNVIHKLTFERAFNKDEWLVSKTSSTESR